MPSSSPPGWYGKLPTLGDFAQRRMDAGFLAAWDAWLAAGLLDLQRRLGAGWLDAYLASPSWRFVLAPGALPGAPGTQAWAGVLMPSVDRVGRYFPFSLVLPLATLPASVEDQRTLWAWLARLDDLAADALHEDWTVAPVEDALARMALPAWAPPPAVDPPGLPAAPGAWRDEPLSAGADIAAHLAHQAQALWRSQVQGLAWWHAGGAAQPAGLRISRGLPQPAGVLLGETMPAPAPASAPSSATAP